MKMDPEGSFGPNWQALHQEPCPEIDDRRSRHASSLAYQTHGALGEQTDTVGQRGSAGCVARNMLADAQHLLDHDCCLLSSLPGHIVNFNTAIFRRSERMPFYHF